MRKAALRLDSLKAFFLSKRKAPFDKNISLDTVNHREKAFPGYKQCITLPCASNKAKTVLFTAHLIIGQWAS